MRYQVVIISRCAADGFKLLENLFIQNACVVDSLGCLFTEITQIVQVITIMNRVSIARLYLEW